MLEHWLLNLAIELGIPLSALASEHIGLRFNVKEFPGYSASGGASALSSLAERGLIRFAAVDGRAEFTDAVPTGEMLLAEMTNRTKPRRSRPYYKLTEAGGALWESLAEPDWSRMLTQWTDEASTPSACCTIESPNMDSIMARIGWFRWLDHSQARIETVAITELQDHPITYWKKLALVYRATFSVTNEPDSLAWLNQPKWFEKWRIESHRWHKQPWELPDWPKD